MVNVVSTARAHLNDVLAVRALNVNFKIVTTPKDAMGLKYSMAGERAPPISDFLRQISFSPLDVDESGQPNDHAQEQRDETGKLYDDLTHRREIRDDDALLLRVLAQRWKRAISLEFAER